MAKDVRVAADTFITHALHFRADLSRPGQQLYQHTLAAYLESAVRTTSAQHDDKEILERLDVRCLEVHILGELGGYIYVYTSQQQISCMQQPIFVK